MEKHGKLHLVKVQFGDALGFGQICPTAMVPALFLHTFGTHPGMDLFFLQIKWFSV